MFSIKTKLVFLVAAIAVLTLIGSSFGQPAAVITALFIAPEPPPILAPPPPPAILTLLGMDGNIVGTNIIAPANVNDPNGYTDWSDLFDANGNALAPPAGFANTKWVNDQGGLPAGVATGVGDDDHTVFTGGSHDVDDISKWSCTSKSTVTGKIDLLHAYGAYYVNGSTRILYLGAERYASNGDASMGFWLLKDGSVGCVDLPTGHNPDFTGNHKDGDRLITTHFTNGGGTQTVNVYRWNGDGVSGSLSAANIVINDCTTAANGVCSIGNYVDDIDTPWLSSVKDFKAPDHSIPNTQFIETAVDLTALGITDCFGSALAATRSSQSETAELHDYTIIPLGTCGKVEVEKITDPADATGTFNFTTTSPAGTNPLPPSFSLPGPGSTTFSPVHAGTGFSITEATQSGWYLSSSSCTNGTPASFDVTIGTTVKCTFTNTKLGKIIINKTTTGGNGTFTFKVDGPNGFTTTVTLDTANGSGSVEVANLKPGDYTITEINIPNGWVPGSNPVNVHVNAGDTGVPANFTNNATAKLTLDKIVNNDNGGTADKTAWTLSAAGSTPISGSGGATGTVNTGTYTLSENGPSGYSASDWVCEGGGQQDGNKIKLSVGEDVTCKITNTAIAPKLTLKKHVTNNNTGSAQASAWKLNANGTSGSFNGFGSPAAGLDASISSNVKANVQYTLSETDGPANYAATDWSCTGGGTFSGPDKITLGLNEDVTCTITNNDFGTWDVRKVLDYHFGGSIPTEGYSFDVYVRTNNTVPYTYAHAATVPFPAAGGTIKLPIDPSAWVYVTEDTVPTGYELVSLTGCGTAAAPIQVSENDHADCVVTNKDIQPKLTVIKKVVNDFGGSATSSSFTMTVTGTNVSNGSFAGADGAGTSVTLNAGSYSVGENSVTGYTQTSAVGDCSGTAKVGDNLTCTITNHDVQPKLTVIKKVVNGYGGGATSSSFTMTVSGTNVSSGSFPGADGTGTTVTLNAGNFSVGENSLTGYEQTSAVGACSGTANVGDNLTCTITNHDIQPKLTVIKKVVNGFGGGATSSSFTMTVSGTNVSSGSFPGADGAGTTVTLNAGNFSVGENSVTGYEQTSAVGACSGTANVGDNLTCTITNHDVQPKLTVIKKVVNGYGGGATSSSFTMTVTGTNVSNGSFPGADGAGTTVTLNTGSFSVGENSVTGYEQTSAVGACSGTANVGDNLTCTITNHDIQPKLTVIKKVVNGYGGGATSSSFTMTVTGTNVSNGSFPGADGTGTTVTLNAGNFSVGENSVTGYEQTSAVGACSGTANVGDNLTCTITNHDVQPKLTVIKKVVNGYGGGATSSSFTMTVTGTNVSNGSFPGADGAGTTVTLNAGNFSVGENSVTGYEQTSAVGACSGTANVGDNLTCTITNHDVQPKLTVIKKVVNGYGGGATSSSFTMTVTGTNVSNGSFPGADGAGTTVTLNTGAFSVGENSVTGYEQTSAVGACSGTANVGDNLTCTITNHDVQAKLTVIKKVVISNGGTATSASFTMNVTGTNVSNGSFPGADGAGTTVTLSAGSFSVGENSVTGYTQTSAVGDCSGTANVGDNLTCTITNHDQPGKLIVKKLVINNNPGSGTKHVTDFSFSVNGDTPVTFLVDGDNLHGKNELTLSAGSYTVTEPPVDGYVTTYDGCSDINVGNGVTKTCTITNNDFGTWDVTKFVVNNYGGTLQASDFAFNVYLQGTHPGIENPLLPNGFHLHATVNFVANGVPVQIPIDPTAVVYVTEDANTPGYSKSLNSLVECGVPGVGRTVGADNAANCQITNSDKPASLTINKTAVGGNGVFNFVLTAPGAPTVNASINTSVSTSTTVTGLWGNKTYTVHEQNTTGWTLVTPNDPTAALALDGTGSVSFENHKDATVIVKKNMIGGTGSFNFTTSDGGPSGTISTNGGTTTAVSVPVPGASATVHSTEGAATLWTLLTIGCSDNDSTGDTNTRTATFNVVPGETVTCTFTNSNIAKSTVTDSSLCTFDVDSVLSGNQFRVTELMDNSPTIYRVNNTNPGQFYYNLFYVGNGTTNPNSPVKVTISIPYPFITQGAVPLHVYSGVQAQTSGGKTCFQPGTEVSNLKMTVPLNAAFINPVVGAPYTVDVTLPNLTGIGFAYINLHLDFGLKRSTGWSQLVDLSAYLAAASTMTQGQSSVTLPAGLKILQNQPYTFNDSVPLGSGQTSGDPTVYSINDFKKTPGFLGQVVNSNGNGVSGINLVIKDDANNVVGTATTDADGFYLYVYKYTGKGTTWSVNIAGGQTGGSIDGPVTFTNSLTVATPIKSNGVILTNYVISALGVISKQ